MPVTIDHVSVKFADFEMAKRFYINALRPLGIRLLAEFPTDAGGVAALGKERPILWIAAGGKTTPRVHVAFTAGSRAEVDAFYKAGMAAGGSDNGRPGLRPEIHATYYAAFVLDPEGHNIEAVSHRP